MPKGTSAMVVWAFDNRSSDTADAEDSIVYYANFNVTALVDESGTVIERYAYSPYGERTVLDADFSADADGLSDVSNALGHQGLYLDAESALYYNRNRYYSPTLGRFTTRDPLGYVDGMSVYEYVGSSPALHSDSDGLFVDKNRVATSDNQIKVAIWKLMKKKAGVSTWDWDAIDAVDWLEMGTYVANNIQHTSVQFIWTRKGGWIDLKHFLYAAYQANRVHVTHGAALMGGKSLESKQANVGHYSAWGVEDLPSNKFGVGFEPHLPDCNSDMPNALVEYLEDALGGMGDPPMNDIDAMNYIRNFTYDPVMSSKDKDIHVHSSGIPYKGDPNQLSVKLELKHMANNGISGEEYGKSVKLQS
jgi:RHS repeat-associated protein